MIYMDVKGNVVVILIHLYRGYCIWFLKGAIYKTWPENVLKNAPTLSAEFEEMTVMLCQRRDIY